MSYVIDYETHYGEPPALPAGTEIRLLSMEFCPFAEVGVSGLQDHEEGVANLAGRLFLPALLRLFISQFSFVLGTSSQTPAQSVVSIQYSSQN